MRTWIAAGVAAICACRATSPPLTPAGTHKDEGHGLLAQASAQFMTGEEEAEGLASTDRPRDAYGGYAYGGSTYASYTVPQWQVQAPNRAPKYNQLPNLSGAIEGTIALRTPPKLATSCGDIAPSRVAIIYIERVHVGRAIMNDTRPISVGGSIVKRGCTLLPTVQIVTPLPAALAIHGDATTTRVRVASKLYELQAAGRISLPLQPGITRVDSDTGALAAAWILALDTPYYAITDEHGRFRIDELAAGTYEVTVWQAPPPKLAHGALAYGEPIITKRTVKVETRRATRLDVR